MIVNLFNYHDKTVNSEALFSFNGVVAWSLRKEFIKRGIEVCLISDKQFWSGDIPEADHSIVISGFVMATIREDPTFYQKLRYATKGKMTLYLDADYAHWWKLFDHVFTIIKPIRPQVQYVYAGWGADPEFFFLDQREKAVFLDSLMYGYYGGNFDDVYDLIKDVFNLPAETLETGKPLVHRTTVGDEPITVYMPLPVYGRAGVRIPWIEMQAILRKCHFYICTQQHESGLTRVEAATCGALLVVPKPFLRPRTMDSMEHIVFETRQELIEILKTKTDPQTIRKKALEHSWDKVVGRMLSYFEG